MKKFLLMTVLTIFLAGCNNFTPEQATLGTSSQPDKTFYQDKEESIAEKPAIDLFSITKNFEYYNLSVPRGNRIRICTAHDCRVEIPFKLSADILNQTKNILTKAHDGESERQYLLESIAKIEQIIGQETHTNKDRAGYNSFLEPGDATQMDDADETMNTTQYLLVMYNYGLVRYNILIGPKIIQNKWVVVLQDTKTNKKYGLDTSVRANGELGIINPL